MIFLTILLPFISFIVLCFFGRFLGKNGSFQLSSINMFSTFLIAFYFLIEVFYNGPIFLNFGSWLIGSLNLKWEFNFDMLSLSMITAVSFVSFLVHVYSNGYMENDPFIVRFFSLLSLFTFFMLILLSANNLIQLFVGWEGIGICSYFLIGFWYTRIQANKSALKAIIINRIGDISLLIACGLIHFFFKSLDFSIIFPMSHYFANCEIVIDSFNIKILDLICFWLMLAAVGKSAQIGLHIWLPDAMEGPTPVSALIHAATMVTAGIFLIIRCSFIFEYSNNILLFITFLGSVTALFASSIGLVQNDIKKVIAYSTCSQLGYMFFACGLSNYYASIFHLLNHALFKALLFLAAGSIIHALNNEQDMRKMGGLLNLLPVSYIAILIGSLALAGFPFLSGFYSKDFILETALFSFTIKNSFSLLLGSLTAVFTITYSIRLIYFVFYSKISSFKFVAKNIHESNNFILLPLITLTICSIFFGYFAKDLLIGPGTTYWQNSIFMLNNSIIDIDNLLGLKILPVFFSFLFILIFFSLHLLVSKLFNLNIFLIKSNYIYNFLINKWYFDYLINIISKKLYNLCYLVYINIDKGLIEILKPINFIFIYYHLGTFFDKYQNQSIKSYLFILTQFISISFVLISFILLIIK